MFNLLVYLDLMRLGFQARAEYRADFLLGILAAVVENGVTLATLWLIFRQVVVLGGWTLSQATLLYGLFSLTFGLVSLLAGGLRTLGWKVRMGDLDPYLVQPASAYIQLLPQEGVPPLGPVVTAVIMIVAVAHPAGMTWGLGSVALLLLYLVCGVAVGVGILTALYSISFWLPYPQLMNGVEGLNEFARYPASIYPRWLKLLLSSVFPIAFAAYYPAAALTGAEPVVGYLPLVAVGVAAGALLLGALLWTFGLRRYEGAGA